jgi:hypothetical protein
MAWRKWIVRGVVYGIIALCGGGAVAYQRWTNPAAVREQVIAKLQEIFPGAHVSVDSARLRILGGIQLNGLRLSRRDDPEHNEFLQVPSAVFYHDKEKILDGELALRKIELHRPRLRVRRDKNGNWNLQDLTSPPRPDRPLPTVVVHQGTILFEDGLEEAGTSLIEIGAVNITLINDPVLVVTVRGAARSTALGKLEVQGTLHREPLEVAVAFKATKVPLTTALVRRLAGEKHAARLEGLTFEATADAHGEFTYHPDPQQPVCYYDVHCKLDQGRVSHPKLPLPLDELKAVLQCTAGRVRLDGLRAKSGAVELIAAGAGTLSALEDDFEARLEIQHLVLDGRLCEQLPETLRRLNDAFQPRGPATVRLNCARKNGVWTALADGTPTRVSLRPEDVAIRFVKFPYPVEHLTGALDYDIARHHVRVDLSGRAAEQPVIIKGTWHGEGSDAVAGFDIQGNDIPIDETLLAALPEVQQKLARSFGAVGKADIQAMIRHDKGAADFRNEYHVRVHDATLLWDSFPYPLEQVRGLLDIYPKHWEFREFHAKHRGGKIDAHGHSTLTRTADGSQVQGIALEIVGRHVALDDDMRKGLGPLPGLAKAWDIFHPQGRLDFVAAVNHPTGQTYDLDVKVDAQGCAVEPIFFPYLLHDIGGQFHFHHHRLELDKVKTWHGATLLTLDRGHVDLPPGGGYYADLTRVQARDLQLDDDLIRALPAKLQEAARSLQMRDKVQAQSRLVIAQTSEPGSLPDVYWEDCQAWFKNASLHAGLDLTSVSGTLGCVGRHDGRQLLGLNGHILLDQTTVLKQPFHHVQLDFQMRDKAPDVLILGLRAPLFGGDVSGQVRVDFNSALRYELNLTASQIDLKQFGKHNIGPKSEIDGLAVAKLHLTGQGSGLDSLDGHGSIDVPSGKLYNLPLLLDLLKFLGLHWPDRTLFEELHALFGIHGTRVHLRRLDLLGSAICVAGHGEANLDGSDLHVDFYPTWRLEQMLPPAIRPVPPAISKSILTIEMRGKISEQTDKDLKFTKRWIPILTDPLLNLQQRLSGESRLERKD